MPDFVVLHPDGSSGPLPPSPMLPLVIEELVYAQGTVPLIAGIDLRIENAGCTAVLGPNGAGKSLLLRLLHGLIAPTSGRITWRSEPQSEGLRRRQALVFQKPVLLRRSTGANLDYVLATRGWPRRQRPARVAELLRLAGLHHAADRPARVLSGGEQQRLALVRALALEPEVLFLDEPTASLDPASTLAIERLIRLAQGGGAKVILVTHDLGQAKRLAQDVVFLHHGQVEEHTPAAAFFQRPHSSRARAYVDGRLVL